MAVVTQWVNCVAVENPNSSQTCRQRRQSTAVFRFNGASLDGPGTAQTPAILRRRENFGITHSIRDHSSAPGVTFIVIKLKVDQAAQGGNCAQLLTEGVR